MNFAWQSLLREEKQGLRRPETVLIIAFVTAVRMFFPSIIEG